MDNVIEYALLSDEDSDNDLDEIPVEEQRPIQVFRERLNYFYILNENQFHDRFRLSKNSVHMLLNRLGNYFELFTERNNAVRPLTQLLLLLRFCATGSFLITVGDFIGISKSCAHKIIHSLARSIASLRHEFINFPSTREQILQNQVEFFQTASFIRTVGCIDCKHVKIESFGGNDAEIYRNRKGNFSINVQVICNARLEIIDIVARWPGSTHDSTIFNNSRIQTLFENNAFGDAILLGDSGYPNLSYILTPLQDPQAASEQLYNESQIRTRNFIERTFGVWSRQFAVLQGTRFRTAERTLTIIVATAVLHNIIRREKPFNIYPIHEYLRIPEVQNPVIGDVNLRRNLVEGYFENLIRRN